MITKQDLEVEENLAHLETSIQDNPHLDDSLKKVFLRIQMRPCDISHLRDSRIDCLHYSRIFEQF